MRPGSLILNLGPNNTLLPFAPRHAYDASGAGVEILTRCMAAELGPLGIRTATVAPGYIHTPAVANMEKLGTSIRKQSGDASRWEGWDGRKTSLTQRSSLHRT
ncbi:SDR family oxidoreductase [Rhizobium esperanzae]|uniref:SDR family oxidoreductase n=1 Tax=Rhizobium esperanzae TaxID=1967781 RepID=UPI001AECD694